MFTALTYGPANAMLAVDDGDYGEQRVLGKNCTAQANAILEQYHVKLWLMGRGIANNFYY